MDEKIKNRLMMWNFALTESYHFLILREKIELQPSINFHIDNKNGTYDSFIKEDKIRKSLLISSIVYFFHLFKSGKGNELISTNKDSELEKIRNYVIEKFNSKIMN